MKSIKKLKNHYKVTSKELEKALRNCISYYLSEEELEPFILKIKKNYKKK